MKILHVNISDVKGGASIAAYRLHKALIDQDIESHMLVQTKTRDDRSIVGPRNMLEATINILRPSLDQLPLKLKKNKPTSYFFISWLPFSNIPKKINDINPDLVHLHWICGGMLSIKDLQKIKAPLIWSLHDNWAFTGGCHIMQDCENYKHECGNCPMLKSNQKNDISHHVFKVKEKIYSTLTDLNINGVSKWMAACARESSLLKSKKVFQLPNPIDIHQFNDLQNNELKANWGFNDQKKVILFGANKATSDQNKGFDLLNQALSLLDHKKNELVVYGGEKDNCSLNGKIKTHDLGYINDEASLVSLYNASDVMVVPSLQESFGQTAVEAMACKTPVVAFGATGLLDIIDHQVNGYLAAPYDASDLAKGIEWVLNAPNYNELCENARKKVVEKFESKVVAKQYIKMYEAILSKT